MRAINIAIFGVGWYGRGLVYELSNVPDISVRILFDADVRKAAFAYNNAGVGNGDIVLVDTVKHLKKAFDSGKRIISSNLDLIAELPKGVDLFFESTGDVLAGFTAAASVIKQKIHVLTVNSEMDATVGYALFNLAKDNGVIYSNSYGDQPGCLAKIIEEVKDMGFEVIVAGNGKGFLDYHATPKTTASFVRPMDNPQRITSFADGSKQSLEMAVLANGTGLTVDVRGMHGIKTDKETLVEDVIKSISSEGIVDYVLGKTSNLGMSVFVIGKRLHGYVKNDFKYLNRGSGPYYLFFRDYHLCYFETPKSIIDILKYNKTTITPRFRNAGVLTVSKKDLKAGEKLDGIGGYSVYGLIDNYETIKRENLLPLGLSKYAITNCSIDRDTPITYDMVDFLQDNLILQMENKT